MKDKRKENDQSRKEWKIRSCSHRTCARGGPVGRCKGAEECGTTSVRQDHLVEKLSSSE